MSYKDILLNKNKKPIISVPTDTELAYIHEQIRLACLLSKKSDEITAQSIELLRQSEELKTQGQKMWLTSHNTLLEMRGSLPGNDRMLYTLAIELRYGEYGTSDYQKAIELFTKLVVKNTEYKENSAYYLAGMYLKGKINSSRRDRYDRKQNLSDVKTADHYASMFQTNEKLTLLYKKKKQKYLHL